MKVNLTNKSYRNDLVKSADLKKAQLEMQYVQTYRAQLNQTGGFSWQNLLTKTSPVVKGLLKNKKILTELTSLVASILIAKKTKQSKTYHK